MPRDQPEMFAPVAPEGLTIAAYAKAKRLDVDLLSKWGVATMTSAKYPQPALVIPYRGTDGAVQATRFRLAMAGDKKKRFRWRKGSSLCLYGAHWAALFPEVGYVVLVGGESDTQTLWAHRFPALGLPGEGLWDEARDAPLLNGVPIIYAVIEPDDGGRAMLEALARSVIAPRVRLIRMKPEAKDVSAVYLADPDGFDAEFKRLKESAEPFTAEETAAAIAAPAPVTRDGDPPDGDETKVQTLIRLATTKATLFHAPDGTAFADVQVGEHRETWAIRSRGFKSWLRRIFYIEQFDAPGSESMAAAIGVIEAKALIDGAELPVHVRVAGLDGRIYVDLGSADWIAVEIDAAGWRVVAEPPVRFRRGRGMLPLPVPERGGDVNLLRPFFNVRTEADFVLIVAWLLAALRDHGPYPLMAISGEHGSAKTSAARIMRQLIDPNSAPMRSLPREDRDLFIAANNGYVLCFDNVSGLPPWLSDSLCRLSTGGGFATRELTTDLDEILIDAMRPIITNGIVDSVTRPDLADRAITLTLAEIPDDKRLTEEALKAEFDRIHAKALGALLDAVSCGLRSIASVTLERLPRMADFARWSVACEGALGALWPAGTFMGAYDQNRQEMVETTIAADDVATAVREMVEASLTWRGTAKTLLDDLNKPSRGAGGLDLNNPVRRANDWPTSARGMGGRLRRIAPMLRKVGISVKFEAPGDAGRFIELRYERKFTQPS